MKVNIGGQKGRRKGPFKNWTIVDTGKGAEIVMDIMESPLPIKTNSVDVLYSSHTFEHIFADRLSFVFSECHRVLKEGHSIRLVVPDIDIAIQAYIKKDKFFLEDKRNPRKQGDLPDFLVCYLSSWFFTYKKETKGNARLVGGHVVAFNFELMEYYLKNAGFTNVEKKNYNVCRLEFAKCDFARYQDCSLYVEATK